LNGLESVCDDRPSVRVWTCMCTAGMNVDDKRCVTKTTRPHECMNSNQYEVVAEEKSFHWLPRFLHSIHTSYIPTPPFPQAKKNQKAVGEEEKKSLQLISSR
jgi:recombinational DNA repair protein (RecF pathway)